MRLMRNTLAVFGLGLLVLVSVLLVRASLLSSLQITVEPAPPLTIDRQAAAERLAGALRFRTVSGQDPSQIAPETFLGLHDYLATVFPAVHRTLTREVINRYSLLYTWPGQDASLAPILLLGHLDVVPVEPETEKRWVHQPFAGRIADGFIWGRGAIDCKLLVVGTLEAIEALLAERVIPRRTVILAFGHDEEIGGQNGAKQIAALLEKRGVRPAFILDEGMAILQGMVPGVASPVASIGIAEKGYVNVELVVESPGGHASMPPRQTAVGILASAVHALEAHPMRGHLDGPLSKMLDFLRPEMSFDRRIVLANLWLFGGLLAWQLDQSPPTSALLRTTFAPTMLEGSIKENVLPARARAVVNIRVHPSDRIDEVIEHVRRTIDDPRVTIRRLPGTISEPSAESPIDSAAFLLLQRTIRQQFPHAIVAPGLVLGATDSRHYANLSQNVYRFMPVPMTREDTLRIHGTNERVAVEDYGSAVGFYAQLIRNAVQGQP